MCCCCCCCCYLASFPKRIALGAPTRAREKILALSRRTTRLALFTGAARERRDATPSSPPPDDIDASGSLHLELIHSLARAFFARVLVLYAAIFSLASGALLQRETCVCARIVSRPAAAGSHQVCIVLSISRLSIYRAHLA